jgi:hypothetical protein
MEASLISRIVRFTKELEALCETVAESSKHLSHVTGVSEGDETCALDCVHQLLSLLCRLERHTQGVNTTVERGGGILSESSSSDGASRCAARNAAHTAVRQALVRVLRVPSYELDRLLLSERMDLGLLRWETITGNPQRSITTYHSGKHHNAASDIVMLRTRHIGCRGEDGAFLPSQSPSFLPSKSLSPLFVIPDECQPTTSSNSGVDEITNSTTGAQPTGAAAASSLQRDRGTNISKEQQSSPKDVVVDEVRRSIDALKGNAGRLQMQIAQDDTTLQSNEALMQRAVQQATQQSKTVKRITGGSGSSSLAAALPGGHLLSRIPGVELVWSAVLVPLWAVVRQAVLLLLVVAVTLGTVFMMLVVPRLYVRVVSQASSS